MHLWITIFFFKFFCAIQTTLTKIDSRYPLIYFTSVLLISQYSEKVQYLFYILKINNLANLIFSLCPYCCVIYTSTQQGALCLGFLVKSATEIMWDDHLLDLFRQQSTRVTRLLLRSWRLFPDVETRLGSSIRPKPSGVVRRHKLLEINQQELRSVVTQPTSSHTILHNQEDQTYGSFLPVAISRHGNNSILAAAARVLAWQQSKSKGLSRCAHVRGGGTVGSASIPDLTI